MAFFSLKNVNIAGVSSVVPSSIIDNTTSPIFDSDQEAAKFISITGIKEKRHVSADQCTSDLCFSATERLLESLSWDKSEIDILVFVSQTPDYLVPSTSIILQDRLGLSKSCICFDVPLGCSGYVYGLSIVSKFLENGDLKKGLLLVGDTLTRQCSAQDKTTYPLFGDAGSATAIEHLPGSNMSFQLWSDGSGFDSIIIPEGGYRNPLTSNSTVLRDDGTGNIRSGVNTYMNGSEVFSFGITIVPAIIKEFISNTSLKLEKIDYIFFHQANKFMNEMIRKKLSLKPEQVPYSLEKYGNTSSATIPLTISTLGKTLRGRSVIMCGFGVGLSVGIVEAKICNTFVNLLLNYD
jgi:3-oxoacyl-[acyl-carrier-protein] synthase-3